MVIVVLRGDRVVGVLWMLLTLLLNKWLDTGFLPTFLTPVSRHLFTALFVADVQEGGLEDFWLVDSDCSRHMTGNSHWFSSLTPVMNKEYITFGDNGRGRVRSVGSIRVNDGFVLANVALVDTLHYNLLSVLQLLEDDFEDHFKKGFSCILDH